MSLNPKSIAGAACDHLDRQWGLRRREGRSAIVAERELSLAEQLAAERLVELMDEAARFFRTDEFGHNLSYEDGFAKAKSRLGKSLREFVHACAGIAAGGGDEDLATDVLVEVARRLDQTLSERRPDDKKVSRRASLASTLRDLKDPHFTGHHNLRYTARRDLRTPTERRLARYLRWNMPQSMVRPLRDRYVEERIPEVEAKLAELDGYIPQEQWNLIKRWANGVHRTVAQLPVIKAFEVYKPPVLPQCPRCGGTDRVAIGSGSYRCRSSRVVGILPPMYIGPPFGWAPQQAAVEWCNYEYEDPPQPTLWES